MKCKKYWYPVLFILNEQLQNLDDHIGNEYLAYCVKVMVDSATWSVAK